MFSTFRIISLELFVNSNRENKFLIVKYRNNRWRIDSQSWFKAVFETTKITQNDLYFKGVFCIEEYSQNTTETEYEALKKYCDIVDLAYLSREVVASVAQGSKNRSSTDGGAPFTRALKSMGGKRGRDRQTIRPGTEYCAAAITLYNFAFTSASIPPKYDRVNIWMLLPPSYIKYKIRECTKNKRAIHAFLCVILSNYYKRDEMTADCLFSLQRDGNFSSANRVYIARNISVSSCTCPEIYLRNNASCIHVHVYKHRGKKNLLSFFNDIWQKPCTKPKRDSDWNDYVSH